MQKSVFAHNQWIRLMKIGLVQFLVTVVFLQGAFASETHAQDLLNRRISLNIKEQKISHLLQEIEKQADVRFVFSPKVIDSNRKVSVKAANEPIGTILDTYLKPLGINYQATSKVIVLSTGQQPNPSAAQTEEPVGLSPARPVERIIKGQVTDEKNEPLIGVSILVKNSAKGIVTDQHGHYSLAIVDEENTVLVFSFIGFIKQEIIAGNQSVINVTLRSDLQKLNEVVVVGYGTQKRGDITGSVGTVKIDREIAGRPSPEIGQALYGQISGVQVITANGRPGTSTSIQVRGINSVSAGSTPLIVIDGLPTPNYDLNLINPAIIESIEVLKDASSAAIYGSRGANGVILITTKKGKSGHAKLDINFVSGIQQVIDKIPVMNSAEYAQASIDAAQNGWIKSGGDPSAPNTLAARKQYRYTWPAAFDDPKTLVNTDWQDEIYSIAPINKVDLSVSGGTDKSNYLVSGGFVKQKGIIQTSDYSKYTLGLNTVTKVTDWLEIGGSVNLALDQEREPFNRIAEWAVQYPSIYPVYSANGYLGAPANQPGFENYNAILFRPQNGHPLYRITDDIRHRRFNALGNMFASVKLLPGLNFKTALNYFYNRTDDDTYAARDHQLGPAYYTEGSMSVANARTLNFTYQNLLTYDKSFGSHNFSALAGTEYNSSNYYYTLQERRGYDNDELKALSAGRTVFQSMDNKNKSALISYFGRLNYNFKEKYLLSASLRRDGSSRFAPNNKWGLFPAVSAGWVLSQENFLKSIPEISQLKLRASYGFTGNDRFDDYRWIGSVQQGRVAFGNTLGSSYYPSAITNPDLKWERTQQFNIGFDLGLLNNRINVEGDFYRSVSDGLLLDVPVPVVSGFTSVFKNIGKLENKGIELSITSHNISKGSFRWSTRFNISGNRNKLLALGPDNAPMIFTPAVFSGMQKINQVGSPIFSYYGYKYDGVYKNQSEIDSDPAHYSTATPGDGRYADVNGDGKLDANDRTQIGNYNPDFIWGLTNNLSYKGFDFSFLFQGVQGTDVLDENIHRSLLYHEGRNYYKSAVNRWRSEAEPGDGYHYKLSVDLNGYEKTPSSYWINDGSYFRLKSLTLGYTFPAEILQKIRVSSLRVYLTGQNLFTHKDIPVYDPENFSGDMTDASRRGVNANPYPTAKTYSFGINIGL
ncbi:TonB-dependent receptor [Dyadobacter diqingensis]|uniref:TonB-dependent receptor n=1 Tax=Dyadobacter diqingensis TaxID=2938121 RepID=UPI0020C18FF7|nr:TonB-dependent receptor [Dyadobacter diqingensis]